MGWDCCSGCGWSFFLLLRAAESSPSPSPAAAAREEGDWVGTLRVPPTETAIAGTVPVPVAAMMAGSACSRSHRMVSPSDLWPSSRVSWKILAAQVAGIRILRPLPSTFVCRSFVLAAAAATTPEAALRTTTAVAMASVSRSSICGGSALGNIICCTAAAPPPPAPMRRSVPRSSSSSRPFF
ncbi:unnamed protein product [Spirodela intermedia]|uniref:Uncharacterized protein n=1 Tax=Spirodela intermedia TaxID=51605 RepID=A0A7I8K5J8_SPIIN|nr:unnamed protein product [Spirodela intermedia]